MKSKMNESAATQHDFLTQTTTMSPNLYDILGISRNATQEDGKFVQLIAAHHSNIRPVRRAYRRKALETHPDRLPLGMSAAEKAVSEELFRKVGISSWPIGCDLLLNTRGAR